MVGRPNLRLKASAVGLAALVWSLTFLVPGSSVRARNVPVEFTNLPRGLAISYQSAAVLEVRLRGTAWLLDSVDLDQLVARVSLGNLQEGSHSLEIGSDALNLPPGMRVEYLWPRRISIRLARVEEQRPQRR